MLMKSPFVKVLLVLNLLVLGVYGVRYLSRKVNQPKPPTQSELYRKVTTFDPVSEDDFTKINAIAERMGKGSSLSDDDLRFLLHQLSRRYGGKISGVTNLYVILALKQFVPTQAQKQILFQELKPILTAQTIGQRFEAQQKVVACFSLARGGIKEAVPYILPLLDDPNPQVRQAAQRSLDALDGKKGK